jgi:hypothetical protein
MKVLDITNDPGLGATYVTGDSFSTSVDVYGTPDIITNTPPAQTYGYIPRRGVVVDMPSVDLPTTTPGSVYVGVLPTPRNAAFVDASMFVRAPGLTMRNVGTATTPLLRGTLIDAPRPTTAPMTTDYDSTMSILFDRDPTYLLRNLSDSIELATGRSHNALAVGREWIQYVSYTLVENTATFFGLFRGRRGTEPYTDNHVEGELCYAYDANAFVPAPALAGQLQIEVAVDRSSAPSVIHNLSRRSEMLWRVDNVTRYDHWQYTGLPATADPGGDAVAAFFRCTTRVAYTNQFADSPTSIYYDNPVRGLPASTIAILSAPYNEALFDTERLTKSVNGVAPPNVVNPASSTYILYVMIDPRNGQGAAIQRDEAAARGISVGSATVGTTLYGAAFLGSLTSSELRHVTPFMFPGFVDYRQREYELIAAGLDGSADGSGSGYMGAL